MKVLRVIFPLVMTVATVYTFLTPDAAGFLQPTLARFLFWHVPCAMLCSWFLGLNAWLGIRYLQTRDLRWDARLGVGTELGLMLSLLTMATGILFSQVQWGAWWHWDPRQTSFLIVLLLLFGAAALRSAFTDEDRRAASSSAYSIGLLLPALFLIFVFPRLNGVADNSMHPNSTIPQNQLDLWHRVGLIGMLALLGLLSWLIYRFKVGVELLDLRIKTDGLDETLGRRASGSGAVRPVALTPKE